MRKVLSRVVNSEQAIRDCGPQFDLVGFGEDLNIFTRTCYMRDYERGIIDAINFNLLDYEGTCHRRDYEREIVGFHNFTIDDFEVFQVLDIIKKSK
ncbi:2443_t:CDS:2 [Entrophospora sp. SA101]|nr:2443_t:CDS:2 [Entrophospora sp. SA101]